MIAVSNMVLNLRSYDSYVDAGNVGIIPELNYTSNSFLGNIGAPIEPGAGDNEGVDYVLEDVLQDVGIQEDGSLPL